MYAPIASASFVAAHQALVDSVGAYCSFLDERERLGKEASAEIRQALHKTGDYVILYADRRALNGTLALKIHVLSLFQLLGKLSSHGKDPRSFRERLVTQLKKIRFLTKYSDLVDRYFSDKQTFMSIPETFILELHIAVILLQRPDDLSLRQMSAVYCEQKSAFQAAPFALSQFLVGAPQNMFQWVQCDVSRGDSGTGTAVSLNPQSQNDQYGQESDGQIKTG